VRLKEGEDSPEELLNDARFNGRNTCLPFMQLTRTMSKMVAQESVGSLRNSIFSVMRQIPLIDAGKNFSFGSEFAIAVKKWSYKLVLVLKAFCRAVTSS
jgi:hypothetical protein